MTRLVIDAPTLVHLVDQGVVPDPQLRLVAPNPIRSDALQLLLDDVRAGRRTPEEARTLLDPITTIRIRLLGDRVSRATAWRLAVEHGWESLRDAEYVAITRLQADALVSVDERLLARAAGLVPIAPLDVLLAPGTGPAAP